MRRRGTVVALVWLAATTAWGTAAAGEPREDGPVVVDAWARPTPPGATVAAVYLTVVGGLTADRLVGAGTPRAAMTQVHAITHDDGMTRMREAPEVDVPAGGRVRLAPEGMHLMLMGLAQPLVAGERFAVTLRFARAGARDAVVTVLALDAAPPAGR